MKLFISCSWRSALLKCVRVAMVLGMAGQLTGCATTNSEYRAREGAAVLTQCDGSEIIGVWVENSGATGRSTWARMVLLLRPGGTGRLRARGKEAEVSWDYAGGGVWGAAVLRNNRPFYLFKLRTTGRELIYQQGGIHAAFVKADDKAAVEALLKKR